MPSDILHTLASNAWAIFLVVLFFGGSIFVHELGHFLAARMRGVHVDRFSIGFGPKIFSWRGKDGVEYRVSWLPLGGYVALPQLADLRNLEGGESTVDTSKLPPISYTSKMIVFVAGATFNIIFAFLLATVIWIIGQPESSESATTRIGYVSATIDMPDKTIVPSPAAEAGLQVGDVVTAIDGTRIYNWTDLMQTLITGSGRTSTGLPKTVFTIERQGKTQDITLFPRLSGDERIRRVGISAGYELLVAQIEAGSLAEKAGFQVGDEILSLDETPMLSVITYQDYLERNALKPVKAFVKRGAEKLTLTLPARADAKSGYIVGLALTTGFKYAHPTPWAQISDTISKTFQTLSSLLNPRSDIGLNKMAGPVGIIRIFHSAAEAGITVVLMFTILVNVNLAVFNLLPIPVLDGGQMLFATIAKLRRRALPANFIMSTQGIFMVLLLLMIVYVSFFDVSRIVRDNRTEATAPATENKK